MIKPSNLKIDLKKQRNFKFEVLTNKDISSFEEFIGAENVLLDVEGYVRDVTKKYEGVGSIVLTPTSTEQIS